ncbi:ABC transporter A family member [Striga asiatica]|uniref:ABC transporter A family member n=1 Tax=Striga asiatica TaxID=4170 RepID=A0A5A7Q5W9_STRAF|nr:ABC transporter A family member [Striga asiatica]
MGLRRRRAPRPWILLHHHSHHIATAPLGFDGWTKIGQQQAAVSRGSQLGISTARALAAPRLPTWNQQLQLTRKNSFLIFICPNFDAFRLCFVRVSVVLVDMDVNKDGSRHKLAEEFRREKSFKLENPSWPLSYSVLWKLRMGCDRECQKGTDVSSTQDSVSTAQDIAVKEFFKSHLDVSPKEESKSFLTFVIPHEKEKLLKELIPSIVIPK